MSESAHRVSYFEILTCTWHDAPPLKEGRFSHRSISVGDRIYQLGGYTNYGSIESLKVGKGHTWKIIHEPTGLTCRSDAAVVVLKDHIIAVFGGVRDGNRLNDGFLFDTEKKSVDPILDESDDLKFKCTMPVWQVSGQNFITVG